MFLENDSGCLAIICAGLAGHATLHDFWTTLTFEVGLESQQRSPHVPTCIGILVSAEPAIMAYCSLLWHYALESGLGPLQELMTMAVPGQMVDFIGGCRLLQLLALICYICQ